MTAAHPDRGGTNARFVSARARYVAARHAVASGNRTASTSPLTARTVLNIHRCLHTAFEQARKWKLIAENPARDARAPSPERSCVRALTADEVGRLLKAAADDPELYALIATLLICGLRRGEVLGLCFDAIDFEAATLEIKRTVVEAKSRVLVRDRAKTESSGRKLRIPPELVVLLRAQRARVQEQMLQWGGNINAILCLYFRARRAPR